MSTNGPQQITAALDERADRLRRSGLFDESFYRRSYADVTGSGLDPLMHYLQFGEREGRCANPLFDEHWYRAQHPEADASGLDPLRHYLEVGAAAGFDPHPLFDTAFYLGQAPDAASSGLAPLAHYQLVGEPRGLRPHPLFDPTFYRSHHADLAGWPESLLAHFIEFGAREGRPPNPLFDARWYRAQHPEVDASGLDPFRHYVEIGAAAGFDPHPLFDAGWYSARNSQWAVSRRDPLSHYLVDGEAVGADPHPLFDTDWYRRENPEAAGAPLSHYVLRGEALGRRPNPVFDPAYYRAQNPDLRLYPLPLLSHYFTSGWKEARQPHPLFEPGWYGTQLGGRATTVEPLAHWLHEGCAAGLDPHPLFDSDWYRAQHAEIDAAGENPLAHWDRVGARSGFDPHPLFDTAWYRAYHASAFDSDSDPLRHYLCEGAASGWIPNRCFDPAWYGWNYGIRLRGRETPLGHLAREGAPRGRRPGRLFDFCAQFFRDASSERRAESPLAGWFEPAFRRLSSPAVELKVAFPQTRVPNVSIVVPAFGPIAWTLACLRSIARAETRASYEVVVVDDEPDRGLGDALAEIPYLRVVRNDRNEGFVESCNRGAREARGAELIFLNNDTLVTDGWLDALLNTRAHFPSAGLIGAKLLYPNGLLQEAGGIVRSDGSAANFGLGGDPELPIHATARVVDYVSAAAVLIDRKTFFDLGGFDAAFRPAFYEDTDLAFRIRERGQQVVYQPGAAVVHFGGASYGHDEERGAKRHQLSNRETFRARWAARLQEQPESGVAAADAALARYRRHALVIDSTTPTPDQDSGSLRMTWLLRILRGLGFHVTFVAADLGAPEPYVNAMRCAGIEVHTPPSLKTIGELLETIGWRIDLAILSRPDVGSRFVDPVRLLCPRATLLYDTVDLHFLRRAREMALRGHSAMGDGQKQEELRAARRADGVLVVSDSDRDALIAEDSALRVHVLSNIHEAQPTATPFAERSGILFIGGFRHAPNADAVAWFVRDVLPLVNRAEPQLRFHVIGSAIPDEIRALASDRVSIEGHVPHVTPFFERCRLSVAPLRYGAGVKGKVNQTMSYGVPCVATTIAAEGMEVVPGEDLLVADDAESFAARVIELYRDAALWARLRAGGLRNIERVFSVRVAEERLAAILRSYGID